MAVDQTILDYYASLLIAQYRNSPNMIATTKLLVNQSLCDGLPQELQSCFNLATATGEQLNIIGEIVGVPRNVIGLDLSHTFFNFTDYTTSAAAIGFGSYTVAPYSTSLFRSYFDSATYTLTDYEMGQLIYLKILYNNTFSSTKNIDTGLFDLFEGNVLFTDNKNMTVTFTVASSLSTIFTIANYLKILPIPMGVGVTINTVTGFVLDDNGRIVYDDSGHYITI